MSSKQSLKPKNDKPVSQHQHGRAEERSRKDQNPPRSPRKGWIEQGVCLDPTRRID